MNKVLNQVYKNLLTAVVSGVCYALFAFWENGEVDLLVVLAMIGFNFAVLCLLCLIAPPLRKLTGHDKKADDNCVDSSDEEL